MREFNDRHGKAWQIELSFGLLTAVRNETKVNLLKFFDEDRTVRDQLLQDDETFFTVLCSLLKIGPEHQQTFAEGMNQETFEQAGRALVEALIDYFPPEKRVVLNEALQRTQEAARELQTERQQTALRKIRETPLETIKAAMRTGSKVGTGSVPASSDSTLTPTP